LGAILIIALFYGSASQRIVFVIGGIGNSAGIFPE
jgi:hypothetical protein